MVKFFKGVYFIILFQISPFIFGSDENTEIKLSSHLVHIRNHQLSIVGQRCKNIRKKYLSGKHRSSDVTMLTPIEKICVLFKLCRPWKDIERKYKKYRININASIPQFNGSALLCALKWRSLRDVLAILEDENVDVCVRDSGSENSPLHLIASCTNIKKDQESLRILIALKLINKDCPVNALNCLSEPALANVYSSKNFNVRLSTLLIDAGAFLMLREKDKKWNILSEFIHDSKEYKSEALLQFYLNVIQDAFYKTLKADYEVKLEESGLMTALIFKWLQKDKKIFMPKPLINYIASFCINPTKHIEATIKDAHERLQLSDVVKAFLPENSVCNTIKSLITPGVWNDSWERYRTGDRGEDNLVVKAIIYTKQEKHQWNN